MDIFILFKLFTFPNVDLLYETLSVLLVFRTFWILKTNFSFEFLFFWLIFIEQCSFLLFSFSSSVTSFLLLHSGASSSSKYWFFLESKIIILISQIIRAYPNLLVFRLNPGILPGAFAWEELRAKFNTIFINLRLWSLVIDWTSGRVQFSSCSPVLEYSVRNFKIES